MPLEGDIRKRLPTDPASSACPSFTERASTNRTRQDRAVIPRATGRSLFNAAAWDDIERSLKLSDRERQITQFVFDDQKEPVIAADLRISRHTVNTYLRRLYHKLGVSSRAQLIVRVVAEYMAIHGVGHKGQHRSTRP